MILEKVIDHAVEKPNSVAIVDDKRTLTYRDLVYGSNLFVDLLAELAPRQVFGDKVGLLIPPTDAFVVAFGGTRWANRIVLPLNYLLKVEELAVILKDAGLKVILPTLQEIRAFVRERIAPYKSPKEVYFMDQLPMTPTGKVLKRALQAPAA